MRSIFRYFNGLREKRARDQAVENQFKVARQAISEERAGVETLLEARFTPNQRRVLLTTAIQTDNPDLFRTVLDALAGGDPNYRLVEYSDGLDIAARYSEHSMLYQAIASEKPQIALWLAANPRTDIRYSGYSESSYYHSGGFTQSGHTEKKVYNCPPCLNEARDRGLTEVAAILAQREATLLRSQAAALQGEAARLLNLS